MKKLTFSLFCSLLFLSSFAQKYLEYSTSCMDRMVYKLENSKKNSEFVGYQIHLGNQQYVYLEIGAENKTVVQSPPEKPSSCVAFPLSKRVVEDINTSKRVVYIVKKERNGYIVSPVKKATYFYQIGAELDYASKDAHFALNLDNPTYGRDIAMAGSASKVFLDAVDFFQCSKGYVVRKTKDLKAKNYKEVTFLPGIGVKEKRSVTLGRNGAKVNVIKLATVNGKPVSEYIAAKCVELQATNYDRNTNAPIPESFAATTRNLTVPPTQLTAKGSPCGISSTEGYHVVQTGETLYSIARRYGISLAQLRAWNSLTNSNVINPCQRLMVLPKATIEKNQGTSTPATSTPPASTNPKKVTSTFDRTYLTGKKPAWAINGSTYIVQAGESVAGIAKKFGYTEERLRWMNGMGERENIFAGQVIRVDGCNTVNESTTAAKGFVPYNEETERIDVATNTSEVGRLDEFTPKSIDYSNVKVHIVQAGETLFSIARDYGIDVDRIREINGFTKGEVIMQSQRIYVE